MALTYPKGYVWYNSERRENMGMVDDARMNPYSYHFYDTNHFILNLTGYDNVNNQKETTIFTYANGVRYVVSMYYTESSDTYNIQCQGKYIDSDGNVINNLSIPRFTLYAPKQYYSSVSSLDIWYASSLSTYTSNNSEVTRPAGAFIYRLSTASPYDPPSITNNTVSRTEFRNYYGMYYTSNPFGSNLDDFIDGIEGHGDGTPITPILPSDDTSHTGGGDSGNPNYDPFSDPINSPNVPSVSSLDTGFISAYNPTKAQLQEVASVMWSDNFIQELKKIWNSPIEGIVSLHMLPFVPPTYGYANCKIGNYNTGISMKAIFSQYIKLQGGSIHVDERWCSALDYSPYTRAFIHIPFVGIQPVNIDDVMNKTVTLEYVVDVLTGSGVAFLNCGGSVLHTYPCNMAMKIPFTMSDHQLLYQSLSNFAVATGKAVAAGGSSPSATAGAISSALNVVTSKHSTVQKSGVISSTYGMLDNFTAYIILHRPIQSLASDFAHFKGYPCNITYTLSSLSGYTEVEYAHLEGVTATDAEKEEIQSLLSQGVIL